MPIDMHSYQHERIERKLVGQPEPTPLPAEWSYYRSAMQHYLYNRNLDYDLAKDNGWYPAIHNGPRIIIPCKRTDGKHWWQARLIESYAEFDGKDYKRWDGAHGYRHDAVCYIHVSCSPLLVVCEGPMDVLAVAGTGYAAVGVLGATPPPVVVSHVAQLTVSYPQVIIIPDTDRLDAWQRIQMRLRDCGVHAPMYTLPQGYKDMAEALPEVRKEFFGTLPWLKLETT